MNILRRHMLMGWLVVAMLLVGCASVPPSPVPTSQERVALAPTGKLRVGLYLGSPTSMVVDKAGNKVGVAYELGRELARWLDVPFEPVEYRRIAEVINAIKAGEVDFTFTNATEARARDVNFTPPMVSLELGYLVPAGGKVQVMDDVDRAGVRVGVAQGSTSQGTLGRLYKQAVVVPVPSLKVAGEMLGQGKLDAFATNKGILYELADSVPGARVLEGRWGLEHMAVGIPKGREAGLVYVREFAAQARASGLLQSAIERAGLRGTAAPQTH